MMREAISHFVSYQLLPIVFNMSLTASVVIVFVLLARLALNKAPKVYSYALWAAVLFRLLCPVSVTSGMSLLALTDPPVLETTTQTNYVAYIPPNIVHTEHPKVHLPIPRVSDAINETLPQGQEQLMADPMEFPIALATLIWLFGILALLVYSVISLRLLRRRLLGAIPLRENIYLADYLDTPFVMGVLRPRIYLPSALSEREQEYIILHEQHHIRRCDHIIKLLAFMALCVHWFNPLVWLAFVLSGKDMEMSCDEAVITKMGEHIRADYSSSLLNLATGRRMIAGMPLAFGEGDTKERIKNLLNWKRPKLCLTFVSTVVCATVIAACGANPVGEPPVSELTGRFASMEDYAAYVMELEKEIHYYTVSEEMKIANITDRKLDLLNKLGELEDLAPDGVLEVWEFVHSVQIDADTEEIALLGGQWERDGWYDFEGQGGRILVALRYEDGSYDILSDQFVNDGMDFYGYHNSWEEALYDWYVQENGMDLPDIS